MLMEKIYRGEFDLKLLHLGPTQVDESMIFAYALTEPPIGLDARHIQTTALASSNGAHYLLNGQKAFKDSAPPFSAKRIWDAITRTV